MSEFNAYEHHEKRRGRGFGWMAATMALVAFIAGALVMKYLPGNLSAAPTKAAVTATASPMATQQPDHTPINALPSLGNEGTTLSLESGIDIPAIVKANADAVVGVNNMVKGQFSFGGRGNSGNNQDEQLQGTGSGVIISSDGYIVTNNHVVEGADDVTVTMNTGEEVPAKVVGADAQSDLAVLKIEKSGLVAVNFGDSDSLQVGESVVAIGNPMGENLAGTVTHGIISGKNRVIEIDGYTFQVLQTDAAINPGNSGGALVNAKGQLVGINNAKSSTAEGIGFAIPINVAKPIIEQLIQYGGISRPMLGISTINITDEYSSFYQIPVGVGINAVSPNGPAEKAGIRKGDIIVAFDGKAVKTLNDVRDILNTHKVGDTVPVKVYRDSTQKEITVQLTLGNSLDLND